MKTNYILIALAMLAALTMVSCKNNNKKAQSQEPTQEEVQEMKQALADSVLADIDAIADEYFVVSENAFRISKFDLSEEEKMVKPDYLLEPSFAKTLVTKSQKVNALAIYIVDLAIRKIYDIPMDEAKEVIAKLAVELDYQVPYDDIANLPKSERIRKEYEKCKEKGELTFFWQSQNAIIAETGYILAQNPELFYSKITDAQWQTFCSRYQTMFKAIEGLAKFDEEMSQLWEFICINRPYASDEESASANQNVETAKQYHITNKDKFINRRNALLQ